MTPLCELCLKHGTDKAPYPIGHGYSEHYYEHLSSVRESVRNVLEVGICGGRSHLPNNHTGASLFVWRDFFPNAEIHGLDNDPRWLFSGEERIHTHLVDAYHSKSVRKVLDRIGVQFDFIVDDAVHDPIPQITIVHDLYPYLKQGGLMVVEDVCPYKLLHNDVYHMVRLMMPPAQTVDIVRTHIPECMLFIR